MFHQVKQKKVSPGKQGRRMKKDIISAWLVVRTARISVYS